MPKLAPPNLKCYVCCHVFEGTRPILLVAREQGDWMLLCGGADHASGDYRVVGASHLADRDPTLHDCGDLPDGYEAERSCVGGPWIRTPVDTVSG